jgi:cell division protein FtsX
MFAPVRIIATIVLFASMGLVFVGAFVLGNAVRIHVLHANETPLGLMLFPAAVYKYVPALLFGLPHELIHPTQSL